VDAVCKTTCDQHEFEYAPCLEDQDRQCRGAFLVVIVVVVLADHASDLVFLAVTNQTNIFHLYVFVYLRRDVYHYVRLKRRTSSLVLCRCSLL